MHFFSSYIIEDRQALTQRKSQRSKEKQGESSFDNVMISSNDIK